MASWLRTFGLALGIACLVPATGAADGHFSVQGGAYAPFKGDVGYSITFQLLGSNHSGRSRFGGEFEYRAYDTKIAGVSDVAVDQYILRFMWQYHFRPDALFTPYLGLGFGASVSDIDERKVNIAKGRNFRGSTGGGIDGVFLLGFQGSIPGAEYMSFFVEGRVGLGFDATGRDDKSGAEFENFGGALGNAGIRLRF